MCNKCAEHMQEATVLNEAVHDMSLTVERLEAQNAYLKADRDQTAEGLAAAQDYVGCLEAERDILVMRVDYLTADRDQKRRERDELRNELAALKRRITSRAAWQDVYLGG